MGNDKKIIFHIGYHKTGTTWLQKIYFRRHPNIHLLSNSAEPWNDSVLRYLIRTSDRKFSTDKCRELINQKVNSIVDAKSSDIFLFSAERLSGHPYSGGFDSFRIAKRIYSCMPDAFILCVIRNQVDMLSSIYKQLVSEGYPGKIQNLFNTHQWKAAAFDLEFYEYDLMITKYQKLFGKKKVLVLQYENMKKDLNQFIQKICNFFNIPYMQLNDSKKKVNPSLPNRGISIVRFLNHFKKTELNPYPLFILPNFFQRYLIRLLRQMPKKTEIFTDKIKKKIESHYLESNKKIEETLGYNLFD